MPTTTTPTPRVSPRPLPNSRAPLSPAAIAAAGAAYAAAELAVAIGLGGFFEWGRAEALLFLAFRPWLLLLLALLLASRPVATRIAAYAAALLLAAASETLLLLGLGASAPWREMAAGFAGGAALLVALDLILQAARRFAGRWGARAAGALLAMLFLAMPLLRPYEALVLDPGGAEAARKPPLMLMTALPIVWGEGGAFDPQGRPAESFRMLEREFAIRPLDALSEETLGEGSLLLIAQPRALAPAELVALDQWVREGGRALILTDPQLRWPSELPLGDIRRPPAVGLLGPLLDHWGLALEPAPAASGPELVEQGGQHFRLELDAPGRFAVGEGACRIGAGGWMADCRIGEGRAVLVADADLLHDRLWAPFGPERHRRTADNPLLVAAWLDALASEERNRAAGLVAWFDPQADRPRALLVALLPLLAALAGALILRRKSRG